MKILSPEEWIKDYHPDPDNIHECVQNRITEKWSYPIKEETAYKLMQQYADYVHAEKMKEIMKWLSENCFCPQSYGFEGPDTFPGCGECIICKSEKIYPT